MKHSSFQLTALAATLSVAEAKYCRNVTIPVTISARNGVFHIPEPATNMDVTTFAQMFTKQGSNYSQEVLTGYRTENGTYDISATYCTPTSTSTNNGNNSVLQFLVHGIGFDKVYWDLPYDNFAYSYVDVAIDQFGYSTFAIDRLGIGNSSSPTTDPISVVQSFSELSAIYELTLMLRSNSIPCLGMNRAPAKIVHVGHSFGSILSMGLAALHPTATDGLILTGYSTNTSYMATTFAAWNLQIAAYNQPLRFGGGNLSTLLPAVPDAHPGFYDLFAGLATQVYAGIASYASGYLTWSSLSANQFTFLYPAGFITSLGPILEQNKQPVTIGEILTMGGGPKVAEEYRGPVMVVTGEFDAIFCGGDCYNTGGMGQSIPAMVKGQFPVVRVFEVLVQPGTGHAVNVHRNSTAAFVAIQRFLEAEV